MADKLIIAIDPGIRGAVAIIANSPSSDPFITVFDMPTEAKRSGKQQVDPLRLWELLCDATQSCAGLPRFFVVEQVSAMPGQGVSSMFSLGDSYGCARTVASVHGRCATVSPVIWKKAMKLTKNKDYSRTLARKAFPSASPLLDRKKDEGRAEALLLAQYAARNLDSLF